MDRFVAPARPLHFADLEQRGLGRLLERYVRSGADGTRVVTYLYTSDPRWKREAPPGLAEALAGGDPGVVVTGINVVNHEFRKIFMREAPRAATFSDVREAVERDLRAERALGARDALYLRMRERYTVRVDRAAGSELAVQPR